MYAISHSIGEMDIWEMSGLQGHQPARLAESMSSRFSEKHCLKNMLREDILCLHIVYIYTCIYMETSTCIFKQYTNACTHK